MKKDLTTKEVAEELGVHQTTVQRWIREGYLEARKRGPAEHSPYRVSARSVDELRRSLGLESSPN